MNPTSVFVVLTSALWLIKTQKLQRVYDGLTGAVPADLSSIDGLNIPKPKTSIDPGVIKFVGALLVAAILVEVINRFSEGAAWTLVLVLVLGFMFNNQIALNLFVAGVTRVDEGIST